MVLGRFLWQASRLAWRVIPMPRRSRFLLRQALLRSLGLENAGVSEEVVVTQLGRAVSRLSGRWVLKGLGLLLRGDVGILRQHLASVVQHEINAEHSRLHQALTEHEPEPVELEPWPADRPLVSVVIPCFNYGAYAIDAVRSVLDQTFKDVEILVVDGGSTNPESLAALGSLQVPRTRIFFREGRRLVGDNRNFGIGQARGKYVCCLDADDRLLPTYLEKALFLLEAHGYDVVSTSIRCFGDKTTIYSVKRYPALRDMLEGNHVPGCAVFRRQLWQAAGGFRDTGLGAAYTFEDWRLWMRFAAMGARIANLVDEPLFLYRCHSTHSLSSQGGQVRDQNEQGPILQRYNRDVLTPSALQRSDEKRDHRLRAVNPAINLRAGLRSTKSEGTILIALPFLILGGAERLISQVVGHLVKRGLRVVIVTTLHVGPEFGDTTSWFEGDTPEIYHLPRFLEARLWRDFVFHLFETREISLLWVIGSAFFYDLLPDLKERYPDLKTIDLLFNTVGHTANNRKYERYFDRIVVENRDVVAWLVEAGESPARIVQIESGVDLTRYRPREKSPELLRRLGVPEDAFVVGFSGRLAEEKDPLACVAMAGALRSEPSIYFVMTGTGPLADQVRSAVAREGLEDRVRYVGAVEDATDYLALYDALVLPSRLDGRPIVVLESLAMGVPVIASRVGALPEVIIDGRTGFLCAAGDVDQFASHIRWLAAHPDERRAMGRAARAFAERHLDAAATCRSYEQLLGEVLGSGGRERGAAAERAAGPRPPEDPSTLAASHLRPSG